VRDELDVLERSARLNPGDSLFLFSDGVVEARAEGSEELFGFERLERCLSGLAGRSVDAIRDGVLSELASFTRNSPREDDLTVLVLEVP
jgi:serine phosphatase RsbU (regulator of sigma subunit)